MKKLIISTLAIVLLQVSVLQASSVSFLNPPIDIVVNNTISSANNNGIISINNLPSKIYNLLFSLEKKKLLVKVKDEDNVTTATAVINFVNSTGVIEGPYTLIEGEILEIELEYTAWEIEMLESTEGAIVEYWFDEL